MIPIERPYLNLFYQKEHVPTTLEELQQDVDKIRKNKSFYTKN